MGIQRVLVMIGLVVGLAGCGEAGPQQARLERGKARTAVSGSAYNPFAGEMPDAMAQALVQQMDGELLEPELQRVLFEQARAHPNDARPWLLLARDSMAREWGGFAERQYASALDADARVIEVTFVLRDLLLVASHYQGVEQGEATALVVERWGDAALPAIEAALSSERDQGNAKAVERLEALYGSVVAAE